MLLIIKFYYKQLFFDYLEFKILFALNKKITIMSWYNKAGIGIIMLGFKVMIYFI